MAGMYNAGTHSQCVVLSSVCASCRYTGLIGKWHLGHNPHRNCMPTRKGFQYFYGLPYRSTPRLCGVFFPIRLTSCSRMVRSHEEGFPGPEFPESLVFPPIPLVQNESVMEQPVDLEAVTPKSVLLTTLPFCPCACVSIHSRNR